MFLALQCIDLHNHIPLRRVFNALQPVALFQITNYGMQNNRQENDVNIGRSIRVALAQRDKKIPWLADQLGVTTQYTWRLTKAETTGGKTLISIAKVFDMPVSEFVALGEE